MSKGNHNRITSVLWGRQNTPLSMKKQVSRIIVLSCIVAVAIQAIVMIALLLTSYVKQEKEDTQYIMQSAIDAVNTKVQLLEEMVLTVKNQLGLKSFYSASFFDLESDALQLKNAINLFSERNRMNTQYPFVEKVYLFNLSKDCISDLYYPSTITQTKLEENHYREMNILHDNQEQDFLFYIEEEHINLCVRLYDDNMERMGSCILVMSRAGIQNLFSNLDKYSQHAWRIKQGDYIILEQNTLQQTERSSDLTTRMHLGFGLEVILRVPKNEIYQSLSTTVFVLFVISATVIIGISILGSMIARRFVQPLQTVAEKIVLVGRGNFHTKLDTYPVEELNNISETFNEMTNQINALITQVYETKLLANQAQIRYLQAQINPHFMFNVLSMIRMKAAVHHDDEVQKLLYIFSKLLQGKIFRKDEIRIQLEKEMEIVDFYLYLQSCRFGNKITYAIMYENHDKEWFHALYVPRLSIETIVENAVCHGLEPKDGDGFIHIRLSAGDKLSIEIEDDGVGFDLNKLELSESSTDHSQMGIYNTRKLIQNLYGDDYGIFIESNQGQGTKVTIVLPIERCENNVEGNDCG